MRAMRASLRDRYDARWRSFEETFLRKEGAKTIDWPDVPWPPAGVPLVLVDRGEATSDAAAKLAEERKRRCVEETIAVGAEREHEEPRAQVEPDRGGRRDQGRTRADNPRRKDAGAHSSPGFAWKAGKAVKLIIVSVYRQKAISA